MTEQTPPQITREEIEKFARSVPCHSHRDLDILRMVVAVALRGIECEWQPISTAPKDGTPFLANSVGFPAEDVEVIYIGKDGDWYDYETSTCVGPFTHWKPLPQPPNDADKEVQHSPVGEETTKIVDLIAGSLWPNETRQEMAEDIVRQLELAGYGIVPSGNCVTVGNDLTCTVHNRHIDECVKAAKPSPDQVDPSDLSWWKNVIHPADVEKLSERLRGDGDFEASNALLSLSWANFRAVSERNDLKAERDKLRDVGRRLSESRFLPSADRHVQPCFCLLCEFRAALSQGGGA